MGSLSKPLRRPDKGNITSGGNMNGRCGLGPGHMSVEVPLQPGDVKEEAIEIERSALLSEKQAQLETIFARHDDMVRGVLKILTLIHQHPSSSFANCTTWMNTCSCLHMILKFVVLWSFDHTWLTG